jgi:hypothetical protein
MEVNKKNENMYLDNLLVLHKGMLLFLLIVSGNYIGNLFSCRIQSAFSNNVYAKHIIGFISLYFFIILVDPNFGRINPLKTLGLSIPIYFYFLILSKSEAPIFLAIIFLLIFLVLINSYSNYLNLKKTETNDLSKRESFISEHIVFVKKLIIGIIFILTVIGFLVYLGMKKVEYEGRFKITSFILGTKKCKKNLLGNKIDSNFSQGKLTPYAIIMFIKKAFS